MNERLTARSPVPKLRVTALAALAVAAVSAMQAAQAQDNPLTLRASQEFTYDSNLFRAPDEGRVRRDLISTTTLGAGIDQPYGRQRYLADAAFRANVFKNQDQFNNTGYDLLLGMDWAAFRDWAGDIRLTSSQRLAQFEDFTQDQLPTRDNLQRNNGLALRARYGLFSLWSLDGTAGYRSLKFSEGQFADRNYEVGYVSGGVSYRPSDLVRLGALVRYSDGKYPDIRVANGPVTTTEPDPFNRIDYELNGNIKVSGLSTIDGRLAFSKEDHDLVQSRDYDGVTGYLAWIYTPTGKSQFDLRLARDTGTRGDTGGDGRAFTDTRLSTRLSGGWRWAATSKIATTVNASYSRDRYDVAALEDLGGGVTRRETDAGTGSTRSLRLGATYAYSRGLTLECGIERLSRSADIDPTVSGTNYNYTATVANCGVEFALK